MELLWKFTVFASNGFLEETILRKKKKDASTNFALSSQSRNMIDQFI